MAVGLKADDEVIVPNYTMVATPIKARNKLNILKLEQQLYDKN